MDPLTLSMTEKVHSDTLSIKPADKPTVVHLLGTKQQTDKLIKQLLNTSELVETKTEQLPFNRLTQTLR